MEHLKELFEITRELRVNGVEFAICGGIAVALHGFVRFTKDIDLLILVEDLDLCKEVLKIKGYDLSSGVLPFKNSDGSFRSVVRVSKLIGEQLMVVDLLLAEGSWRDAWENRERIVLGDHLLDVVSKDDLIAMKRVAGRSQDLTDIERLLNG